MSADILIVDDTQEIVDLTRTVLEKRGFRVLSSENCVSALLSIKNKRPDLIILDNNLPDRTGLELCKELKSTPETQMIPVILATGQRIEREKLKDKYLPNSFLFKPFDIDQLITQVQKLL